MKSSESLTIGNGIIQFQLKYRDLLSDQGLCISVMGLEDSREIEMLRFDCFDQQPHYHYGPENKNERLMLDKTTAGDSLEWTLQQLREKLPEMIERAGYSELSSKINLSGMSPEFDSLELNARKMSRNERKTVIHDRGSKIIEAGSIRFGIEFRELKNDRGIAIHVMGDIGNNEVEFLTFDCFENAPHYHYGPLAKNERLYLDTTTVPDPLVWALDLFKGGKLSSMLYRAGYRDHADNLNPVVLSEKVEELELAALDLQSSNS